MQVRCVCELNWVNIRRVVVHAGNCKRRLTDCPGDSWRSSLLQWVDDADDDDDVDDDNDGRDDDDDDDDDDEEDDDEEEDDDGYYNDHCYLGIGDWDKIEREIVFCALEW